MYYGWYFDPTMLLILPALLLAIWAQFRVQSTFRKYSDAPSAQGWTAAEMAADLLARNGLGNVRIERVRGSLTDHYDPRTNTLRLSDTVYGSTSLAALGVAAHECGHAMQEAEGYKPLRIREKIVPVAQIGSWAAMPLFVLGLLPGNAAGRVRRVRPGARAARRRRISFLRRNGRRGARAARGRADVCGRGAAGCSAAAAPARSRRRKPQEPGLILRKDRIYAG